MRWCPSENATSPGSGFAQTFIGMDVIIVRFMVRKAKKLARKWGKPVVTQITPAGEFWVAEDDHQDYVVHHPDQPYVVINDLPKVEALKITAPNSVFALAGTLVPSRS